MIAICHPPQKARWIEAELRRDSWKIRRSDVLDFGDGDYVPERITIKSPFVEPKPQAGMRIMARLYGRRYHLMCCSEP